MDLRNYFSRKRGRNEEVAGASCSRSSSQVLDILEYVAGEVAKLSSEQRNVYKSRLTYRREGNRNTHGYTSTILKRECFVNYARSVVIHLQQPEVRGLLEELRTGIMRLNN